MQSPNTSKNKSNSRITVRRIRFTIRQRILMNITRLSCCIFILIFKTLNVFVIFFLFLPRSLERQRWPIAAIYLSPSFQCIKVPSLRLFGILVSYILWDNEPTCFKNLVHTTVIYVQCELNMSAKTIYIHSN